VASDQTALPISTAGSLTAFRYSGYVVPFWARTNTREGRWHRVGDPPTQYWALCPEAAWAELIRAEGLTTEAELDLVKMPLWVCRVPSGGLIDLREPANQEHYGITADEITSDDRARCQDVGPLVRKHARGTLADSAALPGHANLTLFGARRAVDWHTRPALASTLPATKAAIGRPPAGILERVRRPVSPPPPVEPLF